VRKKRIGEEEEEERLRGEKIDQYLYHMYALRRDETEQYSNLFQYGCRGNMRCAVTIRR
jgi:hypothetical protein